MQEILDGLSFSDKHLPETSDILLLINFRVNVAEMGVDESYCSRMGVDVIC